MASTLRLPEDLEAALAAYCDQSGTGKNATVVVALRQFLDADASPDAPPKGVSGNPEPEPAAAVSANAAPAEKKTAEEKPVKKPPAANDAPESADSGIGASEPPDAENSAPARVRQTVDPETLTDEEYLAWLDEYPSRRMAPGFTIAEWRALSPMARAARQIEASRH